MNNKKPTKHPFKKAHQPTRKEPVATGKHAGKKPRTPRKPIATTSPVKAEATPLSMINAEDNLNNGVAPTKADVADSTERIQKVLARGGLASRREIERWIAEERIKLNGNVAKLGDRLVPGDLVYINGRPVMWEKYAVQPTRVLVYHKPVGEVVSRKDPQSRPLVFSRLPKLLVGRWISVGRLDINTSGLLLLTNNGELANRLMHPSSIIDREYAVRVLGEVSDEVLAQLKKGVELEDGLAQFNDVRLYGGEGANKWYHVTVCEGRNRLVRRLWEAVNVTVSRLMRVRYGPVFLPKGLKTQDSYEMTIKELDLLLDYVGLPKQKHTAHLERR
ncbi:MAG: pseudouridine synthase [Methylococcales bacterium]|nr:pseudouridine synthase [Methylococcales bacterium]